jgi:hypothetical protein
VPSFGYRCAKGDPLVSKGGPAMSKIQCRTLVPKVMKTIPKSIDELERQYRAREHHIETEALQHQSCPGWSRTRPSPCMADFVSRESFPCIYATPPTYCRADSSKTVSLSFILSPSSASLPSNETTVAHHLEESKQWTFCQKLLTISNPTQIPG